MSRATRPVAARRTSGASAAALLVLCFAGSACDVVLGIEDHGLAADAAAAFGEGSAPRDGGIDAPALDHDGGSADAAAPAPGDGGHVPGDASKASDAGAGHAGEAGCICIFGSSKVGSCCLGP